MKKTSKENTRLALAAICSCGLSFFAQATTYYVGPNGSDSNAGTKEAPFASLTKPLAQDDVTEIQLLEGTYTAIPTAPGTVHDNFTTADVLAEVTKPVKIVGAGREKTILKCRISTSGLKSACGIYLNNAEASLTGVTICDGGNKLPNGSVSTTAWGLEVIAGAVSNCAVICSGISDNELSALSINGSNAYVCDCVVSNDHKYAANKKNPTVQLLAGVLEDALITDNWCGEQGYANGLYIMNGTARRCTISHNSGDNWAFYAGGVYINGSGTLADSRVAYNQNCTSWTSFYHNSGGCKVDCGTVTNCLFVGNSEETFYGSTSAGGLYLNGSSARAYDCTLVENVSHIGGPQFRMTKGKAYNILIEKLNGVPTYEKTGGELTGLVESAAPGFKDRIDFELPYSSDCRAAGWRQPKASSQVETALLAGKYCFKAGENVVVTAKVTNASAARYAWSVTCGETKTTPAATDILTLTAPAIGDYAIGVEAFDASDASLGKAEIPIRVQPTTCYVKADGGAGTYPYETKDHASCSIQKAVDAVYADEMTRGEVIIAEGTYDNLEPKQYRIAGKGCRHVILTKPVNVHGEQSDPESTWVKFASGNYLVGGMLLSHTNAVVHGFKLTCAGRGDGRTWHYLSSCLQICAGLASNMVVCGCTSYSHNSPPVQLQAKGVMTHSVVRDNRFNSNSWGRYSTGVRVNGGKLFSSSILRNGYGVETSHGDQLLSNGVLVDASGSVVSNCLIEGNSGHMNKDTTAGGLWMSAGTVERCIIQCNTNSTPDKSYSTGGVYFSGGTLRNCLIAGNSITSTSSDSAGGLYINTSAASSKAHHLTIIGNSASSNKGAIMRGSALAASVITGNGNTKQLEVRSGVPNYCCYAEATDGVGTGNTADPISFVSPTMAFPVTWATAGDYAIIKTSAGYNMVHEQYATDDLLGVARPIITAESTDYPDAGAMEVVASTKFVAYLAASAESYGKGDTAVFTLSLEGACTDVREVTWEITENGVTKTVKNTALTYTIENVATGDYSVSAVVENTNGDKTEKKTVDRRVSPRLCYVGLNGKNTWPYDTEETACSNIVDAIDAVEGTAGNPGKIIILPGTYDMKQKTVGSATYLGVLTKAVQIIGRDGPEATVIRQTADQPDEGNGFMLTHGEALITGLTVEGTYYVNGADKYKLAGSVFTISQGTVSNCVVRNLKSSHPLGSHCLAAVLITGGKLLDTRITGLGEDTGHGRAAPVYMTSGLVSGCEIYGNKINGNSSTKCGDLMMAGGVWMSGGVMTNCVVRGNRSFFKSGDVRDVVTAGGVLAEGGELWNCAILCNTNVSTIDTAPATGLAIRGTNTKVRNCLVAGNVYDSTVAVRSPALRMADGEMANVTVFDNRNLFATAECVGMRIAAGTVYNTIVWEDSVGAGTNLVQTGGTLSHCCFKEAVEGVNGNIARNPQLRWKASGVLSARYNSPVIDAGEVLGWMNESATDLYGRARIAGLRPDIGSTETTRTGLMLLVK